MDVAAVLRERRLQTLRRSIAGSEMQERKLIDLAGRATEVVRGTSQYAGSPYYEQYRMRQIYLEELEKYTRKQQFTGEMNPRAIALWTRVCKACKHSGVDPVTFIRAQFTFFHNAFRTAPTPVQLTTDAAVVRGASVKPEKVMTNDIPANIDVRELFSRCEKQMNDLMRAQKLTREEVYRRLVKTRLVAFPELFLNADPVWKQVKDA
jgi:hypothetical protein